MLGWTDGGIPPSTSAPGNEVTPENDIVWITRHLLCGCGRNQLFDFVRRSQRGIACHERHSARIRANINRRQISVRGYHAHARQRAAQRLGGYLGRHRVRSLANFRSPRVYDDPAITINFDVDCGMRHVGADDRIGGPAHVVAAGNAQPACLA